MSLVSVHGVPMSDAMNAYELLDDVAMLVAVEPRLVDLGDWIQHAPAGTAMAPYPACRTAGCIAGWIVMLTSEQYWENVPAKAERILGGLGATEKLFNGYLYVEDDTSPTGKRQVYHGDPAYAPMVMARIRAFQAKHADRLRELPVLPTVPILQARQRARLAAAQAKLTESFAPEPELVLA